MADALGVREATPDPQHELLGQLADLRRTAVRRSAEDADIFIAHRTPAIRVVNIDADLLAAADDLSRMEIDQ